MEAAVAAENETFNANQVQYNNIKELRIGMVAQFEEMLNKCNELIRTENKLAGALETGITSRNTLKQQLSTKMASMSDCVITVGLYDSFKDQNATHIESINCQFDAKWTRFESLCCSWSTHELCVWLRRVTVKDEMSQFMTKNTKWRCNICMFGGNPSDASVCIMCSAPCLNRSSNKSIIAGGDTIKWDDVEKRLLDRNVRGKHLSHLREMMLQFAGIKNMEIIQQMVSEIDRLVREHKEFTNLWNSFESKWMQWNVEELIEWMQFETMLIESSTIDWSSTSELLKAQNMTGKNLPKMNEVVFPFIAIHDSESIEYLMSSIKRLLAEHGESSIKIEPSVTLENVPKEFVCPLTGSMMKDPVIAFDGFSYERAAIAEYLAKHNTSPVTGKAADGMGQFLLPNNNVKAMIEKFQNENKPSPESGMQSEGVVETGYI